MPRRTDGFTARRHSEPVRYPLRKANIDRRSGNGGRCEIRRRIVVAIFAGQRPDTKRVPARSIRLGFTLRDRLRPGESRPNPRPSKQNPPGQAASSGRRFGGSVCRSFGGPGATSCAASFRRKMKANLAKGTTYRERGLGPVWGPATAGRAKTINTKPASSRVKRNFGAANPTTCAQRGQRLERNLTMPEK